MPMSATPCAATRAPDFFYLPPYTPFEQLAVGDTFECVYSPEATSGEGWRHVTYRVVQVRRPLPPHDRVRECQPLRTTVISAEQAEALWERR